MDKSIFSRLLADNDILGWESLKNFSNPAPKKPVLPKITIEGINVIALSPQSPLGSKLMGNQIGFTFDINTTHYCIESIE